MDPTILTSLTTALAGAQVISSIVGGIIGNRADSAVCGTYNFVVARLKSPPTNPYNHDIQRAVREALLRATLAVCESIWRDKYGTLMDIASLSSWHLYKTTTYLRSQIAVSKKIVFLPESTPLDGHHTDFLQPNNVPAKKRIEELHTATKELMVTELKKTKLSLDAELEVRIRNGWLENGQYIDWMDLVIGYFSDIQRTNERVRTAVHNELLLNIQQEIGNLKDFPSHFDFKIDEIYATSEVILKRTATFLNWLESLDGKLDHLQADVSHIKTVVDGLAPEKLTNRSKKLNAFATYNLEMLIGQRDVLDNISDRLKTKNLVIIQGVGGIGRSTVAKAYIAKYDENYSHVAYINVSQKNSVAKAMLQQLATTDTGFAENPELQQRKNFHNLLEILRHIPNTLIVVDGCDQDADLIKYVTLLRKINCDVIITTRCQIDDYLIEGVMEKVRKLTDDEAKELFKQHYRNLKDRDLPTLSRILKSCHNHPKLIVLLAKAAHKNQLSELERMANAVENGDYEHHDVNAKVHLDDEEKRVYDFLMLIFSPDELTDEGQDLLRFFLLLPSTNVSKELLEWIFKGQKNDWNETLADLVQKGWIETDENYFYSLHPVIKLVVHKQLKPDLSNCETHIQRLTTAILASLEDGKINENEFCPIIESIEQIFASVEDIELAKLYHAISLVHHKSGRYNKAAKYLTKSLAILNRVKFTKPEQLITLYNRLAVGSRKSGHPASSLQFATKALEICELEDGIKLEYLASTYNILATTYYDLDDSEKSISNHENAMTVWQKSLNNVNPLEVEKVRQVTMQLIMSLTSIAASYRKRGDLDIAHKKIKEAEELSKKSNLANSKLQIGIHANFGAILHDLRKYNEALGRHKSCLQIKIDNLRPNHPDLAISYTNIGTLYRKLGRLDDALDNLNKADQILKEQDDLENQLLSAKNLNQISNTYHDQGKYYEAMKSGMDALEISERLLESQHSDLATIYNNLAVIFRKANNTERALELHFKAQRIRDEVLPPAHPHRANSYVSIGNTYLFLEEADIALEYFLKAREIQDRILSEKRPDLNLTLYQHYDELI